MLLKIVLQVTTLTNASLINQFKLLLKIVLQVTTLTTVNFINPNLGTLPSQISQLRNLTSLDLINPLISGSLPSEYAQLSQLTAFNNRGNMASMANQSLGGVIPSQFGSLRLLQFLVLTNSAISSVFSSF